MTGPQIATPSTMTEDMAVAGSGLYWTIYHAPAEFIRHAPDTVVRAYMRAQQVFGPPGKPPLALVTTRQLLEEIKDRGEVCSVAYQTLGNDMAIGAANLLESLPGSLLDYRTVDST